MFSRGAPRGVRPAGPGPLRHRERGARGGGLGGHLVLVVVLLVVLFVALLAVVGVVVGVVGPLGRLERERRCWSKGGRARGRLGQSEGGREG